MSTEKVELFFNKVKVDQNLQEELKKIAEQKGNVDENLVKLCQSAGFDIKLEDVIQFMEEGVAEIKQQEELDDAQLEAVAGGVRGNVENLFEGLLQSALDVGDGVVDDKVGQSVMSCVIAL